jgi:AdoMet-dependent heme synthase
VNGLPVFGPTAQSAPRVAFRELRSVWLQITGTLCNLACRHCFNASGPRDPWLSPLSVDVIDRHLAEAESLGVREVYLTGGEPLLHPDLFAIVDRALRVAATTILTNGALLTDGVANRLAALAAASTYSLEVRVSLDGASAQEHDVVRGGGTFAKALDAIRRLERRGLYPIVTATAPLEPRAPGSLYDRLRAALLAAGVERPRIKILPRLALGRARAGAPTVPLGPADLDVLDPSRLQCTETRAVADGGIYACPILAGLPSARLARERIVEALGPTTLFHPVCRTCHETGLTCGNA